MKKILVTGGMGYIGSHTVVELLKGDNDVLIVDNLSNSSIEVVNRIEQITSRNIYTWEDGNSARLADFENVMDLLNACL